MIYIAAVVCCQERGERSRRQHGIAQGENVGNLEEEPQALLINLSRLPPEETKSSQKTIHSVLQANGE
jgi:hypothetical protein